MNAFAAGGTVRTTFTTAAELVARGHDVEIVSVYRRRGRPALPVPPGVRLRVLSDQRAGVVEAAPALRRAAKARPSRVISRFDVRHGTFDALCDVQLARFLLSVRDGVLVGTRPGLNLAIAQLVAPSVVRVGQDHMSLAAYPPQLRAQLRAAYPRLDLVTALTEGCAAAYRRLLGPGARVECMPNGVRRATAGLAALDAPVVVAAGRLSRQKGFDRLLRVWAEVAPQHPDWELRIYGSGRARERLEAHIARRGLQGGARLMGFAADLDAELRRASIYAMTSRREGFPMVLLEAMAAGLPVVSYDCPTGPRDIVREGVDGHVVPDGDHLAMARALGGLMADPERRRAYGAAASERIAAYDPARLAERWEGLFAELAAAKPPGGATPAGPLLALLGRMAGARVRRLARRRPRFAVRGGGVQAP